MTSLVFLCGYCVWLCLFIAGRTHSYPREPLEGAEDVSHESEPDAHHVQTLFSDVRSTVKAAELSFQRPEEYNHNESFIVYNSIDDNLNPAATRGVKESPFPVQVFMFAGIILVAVGLFAGLVCWISVQKVFPCAREATPDQTEPFMGPQNL